MAPVFLLAVAACLLDFGLFVFDVLAYHRIVFLEHHFVGGILFILIRGVVMAGARG
jgi:hypothetical protein